MIADATAAVGPFGPNYHVDAALPATGPDGATHVVTRWTRRPATRNAQPRYAIEGRPLRFTAYGWLVDSATGERYALVSPPAPRPISRVRRRTPRGATVARSWAPSEELRVQRDAFPNLDGRPALLVADDEGGRHLATPWVESGWARYVLPDGTVCKRSHGGWLTSRMGRRFKIAEATPSAAVPA